MVKTASPLALFLALNLVFFTMARANGGYYPTPEPKEPTPRPSSGGSCTRDTLKLGVCVNVLNLIKLNIGEPPVKPCCSVIEGLLDLEAAACLCTTIKANALSIINLDIPVDLSLLINACGKKAPKGFKCA